MSASDCRGARVLVVEDNEAVRAIALSVLVRHGCIVVQARTGAEALEMLASDARFDIVFADINLPGGRSGLHLAEDIAHLWPAVRVLLTTGDPGFVSADHGRPVILKPYRARTLIEAVAAIWTDRRQRGEAE